MVKRYDRIREDKKIIRLHQEDFCQALGISYDRKYEQEGGPTFETCFKLIRQISARPLVDAENLLRWHMFNFLAGNSDGHAKNLSIIYDNDNQIRLAPFYDLVCTRAIERIDSHMAMSVGGEFDPGKIRLAHWKKLASESRIREAIILGQLQKSAEMLLHCVKKTENVFQKLYGEYPALQRVIQVVTKQCKKTLKEFEG